MSDTRLTHKQRLFVEYYIGVSNGNATDAARRAGYAGDDNALGVMGFKLLRFAKISDAISERYTEAAMSANEALSRVASQARASLNDALELVTDPERTDANGEPLRSVRLSLEKAIETGLIHNLASAKSGVNGLELKLADTQGALDKILRAHGVYTGEGAVSVQITQVREYPEGA